mmetsp:Transcript_9074/g.28158  ORF Transcript_9074/g.28158 Transcript_9074/m.28158 type:complete len:270 (+) Transcript_9074:146-955(+)
MASSDGHNGNVGCLELWHTMGELPRSCGTRGHLLGVTVLQTSVLHGRRHEVPVDALTEIVVHGRVVERVRRRAFACCRAVGWRCGERSRGGRADTVVIFRRGGLNADGRRLLHHQRVVVFGSVRVVVVFVISAEHDVRGDAVEAHELHQPLHRRMPRAERGDEGRHAQRLLRLLVEGNRLRHFQLEPAWVRVHDANRAEVVVDAAVPRGAEDGQQPVVVVPHVSVGDHLVRADEHLEAVLVAELIRGVLAEEEPAAARVRPESRVLRRV